MKLTFPDILELRKKAQEMYDDYPYMPLLLELIICGLGRESVSKLKIDSISDGKFITWKTSRFVEKKAKLSKNQAEILVEYIEWRKSRKLKHGFLIVAKRKSLSGNYYYLPITEDKVRSDLKKLGLLSNINSLEIKQIHSAIREYLLEFSPKKAHDEINKRYRFK